MKRKYACPWATFSSQHIFDAARCRLCKGTGIVTKKQLTNAINRLFRRIGKGGKKR